MTAPTLTGSAAKELAGRAVRHSGLAWVVRHTYRRGGAGILVYHDPEPEVLRRHLRYLAPRYAFITLDALVEAIHERDWRRIPPNSLALTFDDGHRGNTRLVEIFHEFGVVPSIFLCTQIVDTRRRFWWTSPGIDPQPLKARPNAERLAFLEEHAQYTPTAEHDGPPQALTAAEIAEMNGTVDFQAHTRFHPILPMCTDAEAMDEIVLSKQEVERLSGRECRHFAFPNGDFTARDLDLVKRAGYRSSRTTQDRLEPRRLGSVSPAGGRGFRSTPRSTFSPSN